MATDSGPGGPADATTALAERLFRDMVGALELYTVYLGERLGLYRALGSGGPATSSELAERTGTAERYIREWLEHHAASGLLEVDDPAVGPTSRRYRLPPAHAPVLADPDDVRYRAFNGAEIVRGGRFLPQLVEAFRTGTAPPPLPWPPEGRPDYNRAVYLNLLGTRWLPGIPDVDRRLRAGPPAHVADLACGAGWSSIAMAQAYPLIRVDGFDLDPDVIAAARRNAEQAGVSDRVTLAVTDASGLASSGRFDLVTILEGLHDMSRPADALRAARHMLRPEGSVIIADELVEDEFRAPASELERYHYGWSVVSCLPGAMGDPGTAATGAVMRPGTLRRYAEQAGFRGVEVLPVDAGTLRFYRLTPLSDGSPDPYLGRSPPRTGMTRGGASSATLSARWTSAATRTCRCGRDRFRAPRAGQRGPGADVHAAQRAPHARPDPPRRRRPLPGGADHRQEANRRDPEEFDLAGRGAGHRHERCSAARPVAAHVRVVHDTDRANRAFAAVLVAFIRVSVRMIRAQVRWWPGNVSSSGTHVHHMVFGVVFMVIAGVAGFAASGSQGWRAGWAALFGVGTALVPTSSRSS